MRFFLVLPVLALLELYLLIKLGGVLGAFNVVLWVILSIVLGAGIIKHQGFEALVQLRTPDAFGQPLRAQLFESSISVIAGFLILLPGILTDLCGGLLLLPWTRRWLLHYLKRNAWVYEESTHTFEGEYERREDKRLK